MVISMPKEAKRRQVLFGALCEKRSSQAVVLGYTGMKASALLLA